MVGTLLRRLPWALLGPALALSACCKRAPPLHQDSVCPTLTDYCLAGADAGQPGACADHTVCDTIHKSDPDHQNSAAVEQGCRKCYFEPRACAADSDCCPGERCGTQVGICFDCYNLDPTSACGQSDCTSDAECQSTEGPGHICVAFNQPDGGGYQIQGEAPSMRCSYPTCHTSKDCSAGASCFPAGATPNGYCVIQAPCGGACAAGSACAVTDDLCSAVPPNQPSCQISCSPGTMLVYKNQSVPTGVYDSCIRPAVECACATLPPIHSDDLGRYSSLAAHGGQVWVSGYDGQYGDLVAFHFNADGTLAALEYVDGVPAKGKVVGDPNGPRHGIADPGVDVGRYTSLALGADGQPRISYFDVDHSALKFAVRQASGSWVTETVDGWDGTGTSDGSDVGRYTSMAIDPGGLPAISYFQAAGPSATSPLVTALKLAKAKVPNPATKADWIVVDVDSAPRPAPPCFTTPCASGQVCINDGSNRPPPPDDAGVFELASGGCAPGEPQDQGGSCQPRSTVCSGLDGGVCPTSDACIAGGADGGGICAPVFAPPAFTDLPQGLGLFSSLAFNAAGDPLIAYYDRLHGDLRLAVFSAGVFQVTTVDGSDPTTCVDTGDVGLFPSLRVNGSTWAIAYQDATDQTLLYWTGTAPSSLVPSERIVVDTGTLQAPAPNGGEDSPMVVGANVSLAFGASGTAYLAYQNQTAVSLRLSSLPAGCGTQSPQSCQTTVENEWATEPQGFYAQVAIDGTTGYLSNAQIQALVSGVDDQLLLEGPMPLK